MMTMLMFLCVVQAMKLGLLSGRYVWLLVMLVHLRITSLHSLWHQINTAQQNHTRVYMYK